MLERRQHARFNVRARVNFKWQDEGNLYVGSGFTRDISTNGMFIFSDAVPPAKADMELDISFPPASNAKTNLRMSAMALVIRLEGATKPREPGGFAVLNRSYALHNMDERKTLK